MRPHWISSSKSYKIQVIFSSGFLSKTWTNSQRRNTTRDVRILNSHSNTTSSIPGVGAGKEKERLATSRITIYCCWEVVMSISVFLFLGEQLCLGQPPVQHRVQPQGRRSTDAPSSAGEFHPQEMAEGQDALQHPVLDYILLRVGFLPFHLHEMPLR